MLNLLGEKVELKGNEKIFKFLHLHDYQFVLIVQFCYFIKHFSLELLLLYLQESKFCIIRNIFYGFLVIFYSYFSLLGVFILHWTLYFPPPLQFSLKKFPPLPKWIYMCKSICITLLWPYAHFFMFFPLSPFL